LRYPEREEMKPIPIFRVAARTFTPKVRTRGWGAKRKKEGVADETAGGQAVDTTKNVVKRTQEHS